MMREWVRRSKVLSKAAAVARPLIKGAAAAPPVATTRREIRKLEEFCGFLAEQGIKPETVIDVGACYGTHELLAGFPDAYHVLIEPVVTLEPHLQKILTRHRGEYHLVALSDAKGEMLLSVPGSGVAGAALVDKASDKTVSVPVETLDGLFGGRRDLQGPVLLKTDCQGYDLAVMKGGKEFLKRVDVVVMEVNMFHPRGDRKLPDFGDIVAWMRDHDFAVYDIISYQTRPFDKALGYVDLVFAPENGLLRKHHRWA